MPLIKDETLDNRYRIIRALGEGGMGAAYLVEDQRLARECVAKAATLEGPEFHQQFEVEARILAEVRHENLPEVYDYFWEEDRPYLVMQLIKGTTLDRMKEDRSAPFDVDQVLRWANDILDALIYLHGREKAIIHRDIKPSNVCITPEGKAVLLDFGIARRLDRTSTHQGAQAQSVHYSPIEQYQITQFGSYSSLKEYLKKLRDAGIHTDTFSDIYSLGATLYFALTLLNPPSASMRILGEAPRPIREINPDAPDFLLEAVDQAMVIDPRSRCQTAQEMQKLLQTQKTQPAITRLPRQKPRSLPNNSITILDQELIYISAEKVHIGTDDDQLKEACHPEHQVDLAPYCIGQAPVTNADYQLFIEDNPEYPVPYNPLRFAQRYNWDRKSRTFPRGLDDHPVVLVTWDDALKYCNWLHDVSGYACRLPTEAEWEKAACWDVERQAKLTYPWGNNFSENLCNVDVHGDLRYQTSKVGKYSPDGNSPYRLVDMAGNIWEWTKSLYKPYPYHSNDGREDLEQNGKRVVRGGAYNEGPLKARSSWREAVAPERQAQNIGFRIACDAGQ